MSDTVIIVENLSKSYMVGHNKAPIERYTALRDVIARNIKSYVRKTKDMLQGKAIIQGDDVEEFWALKDVSFEVKQGDRLGIIGRNGAGKSTLLKILSRITEPTKGRVTINGRVASLLEVGTGFHPELTGRENIYLNGAILGMSRTEIQRKFDEIVDFAEVERFLDTPVKRYSSGMYVRLAFAVAAHLEPEILIVDEVLAVGDAQFQKKCLGKMEKVGKEGRTVLFVSHNMEAIYALCNKGIHLENSTIKNAGDIKSTIQYYEAYRDTTQNTNIGINTRITDAIVLNEMKINPDTICSGDDLYYKIVLKPMAATKINNFALLFYNAKGLRIAIYDLRRHFENKEYLYLNNTVEIEGHINKIPFVEGEYNVGIYVGTATNSGDFFSLAKFSVKVAKAESGFIPYPVESRGLVELF